MKTAAFKKPYVPPSYHDIRTTLLVQARADWKLSLIREWPRVFGSLEGL